MRACAKRKERICSEPSQRPIDKGEFGARITAGADGGSFVDGVINGGRTRSVLSGKKVHVLHNLGDARLFVFRRKNEPAQGEDDSEQTDHGEQIRKIANTRFHTFRWFVDLIMDGGAAKV